MDEIGLAGKMSDMEFMIHVLNNVSEEYDVVLDSLESCLVSTGEDKLTIEAFREKLNSRFEWISSKERERDHHEKALAFGFNQQFKGMCHKCGQYGHKPDSSKCPENKHDKGNKSSRSIENNGRQSKVKCFNCGKFGHKIKDCPKKKVKANQAVGKELHSIKRDSELDLVLCTMDEDIFEHLFEDLFSSENEVVGCKMASKQCKLCLLRNLM